MKDEFFSKVDFKSLIADRKKSSRRQLQIVESAIDMIYHEGLEGFSYEKLAKKCDVARSLIYHYFPTTTDLFVFASAYIRYKYQTFVISKMAGKNEIKEVLSTYIRGALEWVDVMPKEAGIWLVYFHQCSISPELAEHNKNLVDIGTARIQAMLKSGMESGVFGLQESQLPFVSRTIQMLITGFLVSRACEARTESYWQKELNSTVEACLSLALPLL